MRPADHGGRAAGESQGREIESALELMALHPNQGQENVYAGIGIEKQSVRQVRLHVFVHRADFATSPADLARSHAREVGDRAVGHEAAPEALDESVRAVLARLENDDPKRGRAGH